MFFFYFLCHIFTYPHFIFVFYLFNTKLALIYPMSCLQPGDTCCFLTIHLLLLETHAYLLNLLAVTTAGWQALVQTSQLATKQHTESNFASEVTQSPLSKTSFHQHEKLQFLIWASFYHLPTSATTYIALTKFGGCNMLHASPYSSYFQLLIPKQREMVLWGYHSVYQIVAPSIDAQWNHGSPEFWWNRFMNLNAVNQEILKYFLNLQMDRTSLSTCIDLLLFFFFLL